jgi:Prenyltransferase and squalene oxidase repeat
MRLTLRRLAPMPLAALAVALLLAPTSASAASRREISAATGGAISYLKSFQRADGSFSEFGEEWALSALASAGVPAANVKQGEGSTDARSYYRELIGDTATWPGGSEPSVADFEEAALGAYSAGIDPARVSPTQNLIAQIVARYLPSHPGYYGEPELLNDTVFALLALEDTHTRKGAERVPQALLEQSVNAIRNNQHTDGGWGFFSAEGNKEALEAPAEAEFTGATIAALCGDGIAAGNSTILAAKNFLESQLQAEPLGSGAFETEFGTSTDTNAWVVEGLNACGIPAQSAAFTTSAGKTPIDYLISQQLPGGGFKSFEDSPNFYSTQDALRALAGGGFLAAPPKPRHAPRWVYEKQFSTSPAVPALLTLVIDTGKGAAEACAVTVTPEATRTTLAKVLEAAESASSPAGCVSALTPTSGKGAITSINGAPSPAEASWEVSIDGGAEKRARRGSSIQIGDTVYLRLS